MNTSVESLTHKMQRAAVGKMVDVVLSHADKDRQKTVGQLVDVAKQFYGSSFSAEAYEHARQTLTDPDSKWSKLINCVLDQTDPNVARTMALNLGYEAFFRGTKTIRENRVKYQCNIPWLILFDPTSACNMHCVGCWAGEYGHKNNLSFEDMDKIVTEGKELGVYLYMLTGGEPLVRKADILKLAEKHNDVQFAIYTNSTLIDEPFCKEVVRLGNIASCCPSRAPRRPTMPAAVRGTMPLLCMLWICSRSTASCSARPSATPAIISKLLPTMSSCVSCARRAHTSASTSTTCPWATRQHRN